MTADVSCWQLILNYCWLIIGFQVLTDNLVSQITADDSWCQLISIFWLIIGRAPTDVRYGPDSPDCPHPDYKSVVTRYESVVPDMNLFATRFSKVTARYQGTHSVRWILPDLSRQMSGRSSDKGTKGQRDAYQVRKELCSFQTDMHLVVTRLNLFTPYKNQASGK